MPYTPVDPTLTDDAPYARAKAYMNSQFRACGMQRDLTDGEIAQARQLIVDHFGWQDGQPITGAMANYVGQQMQAYVEQLLANKPFPDAPECGTCPSPYSYDHTLLGTPEILADMWGREVPSAPYIPGGSSRCPQKVMTYLLPLYPQAFWATAVDAHLTPSRDGKRPAYNRYYLSVPNARDQAGFSIQQFVDLCGFVQSRGISVGVFFSSKPQDGGLGDPANMSVQQWQDRIGPWMTAVGSAGVIAEAVAGWEWDLWNLAGDVSQQILKWFGQQMHGYGVETGYHASTERWAWQANGFEGDVFWQAINDDGRHIDRIKYQSSPTADIGWVQSRLVDVIGHATALGLKVDAHELRAMAQWDDPAVTERAACLFSMLVCCTRANGRIAGVGNGFVVP